MTKPEQAQVIEEIQEDANRIIVSNSLTVLKFKKIDTKKAFVVVSTQEIGTHIPKIIWEVVSLLSRTDIETIENDSITKRIYIKEFLTRIRGNENNYKYVIDAARTLRAYEIASINNKGQEVYRGFFNEVIHDKNSGYIDLVISKEWARELLDIAVNGNVSFLKQYIFDFQNSHSINIYPTLKAHSFKKKYKVSLIEFKNCFGYNTPGYRFYNNLKKRVLLPAIEEINKKSDLFIDLIEYGSNMEGTKKRITDLVFEISEKDLPKLKQLTGQQPTTQTKEPQPEKQATQKPIQSNEPSEAEIIILGEKLKLSLIQIQTIIGELKGNHIRAFEVLQGCINEGKTKTINSNFAYIITSLSTLGIGLWQEQKEKKQKEELQKIEKQKELKLKILNDEYQKRKEVQFVKIYNDCTEPQKIELLEYIKDMYSGKSHLKMYVENNILTSLGVYMAGQIAAEKLNVGLKVRQNKFREEIYNREKITIDFDLSDKVILSNTLFELEKTQEAPTATDRQQVATPAPTEPKPTNTLTDAQKAENIKKYNEMKLKTVEAVKIPVDDSPSVLEQPEAVELEPEPVPTVEQAEPQAEAEPVEQPKQEPEPKSILSNLINKFTNW